ncbi:MAG: WG repeat-containing protein [Alistipes sp.]|jgi:hypothetical protein|nr:WG repeat-containing protein [Alistipes sp.]
MTLTISQYIEAFGSDDGRFRTFERLRAVPDETGMPVFTMPGHGLVDFQVTADNVRHTLRCPLHRDEEALLRLWTIGDRDRGLGSRFFTEWRLLRGEVVLFDEAGEAFEMDVLARATPVGVPLAEFLEKAAARRDGEALAAALRSFEDLTEWAREAGRGGVTVGRLLVSPGGEMSLTGFSASDQTDRVFRMLHDAAEKAGEKAGYDFGGDKVRLVRDGGGWMYVDGRGQAVIDAVYRAASPFRGERAEVETRLGKGLIDPSGRTVLEPVYEELVWDDYWGVAAAMREGMWFLHDRGGVRLTEEGYDWLGECSEGMLLAERGGRCGFVDVTGRLAIPCAYDEASSFAEGLALVSVGGESFFIDARGSRI